MDAGLLWQSNELAKAGGMLRALQSEVFELADDRSLGLLGNGGSAAICLHLEADSYRTPSLAGRVITPASNGALLTMLENDFGDCGYATWIQSNSPRLGLLAVVSHSGSTDRSNNLLAAVNVANQLSIRTVSLTSRPDCPLAVAADVSLSPEVPPAQPEYFESLVFTVFHALVAADRSRPTQAGCR